MRKKDERDMARLTRELDEARAEVERLRAALVKVRGEEEEGPRCVT